MPVFWLPFLLSPTLICRLCFAQALRTEDLELAGALLVNSTSVSIDVAEDFDAMRGVVQRLMQRHEAQKARQLLNAFTAMQGFLWTDHPTVPLLS